MAFEKKLVERNKIATMMERIALVLLVVILTCLTTNSVNNNAIIKTVTGIKTIAERPLKIQL